MGSAPFLNVVYWSVRSALRWWWVATTGVMFVFVGRSSAQEALAILAHDGEPGNAGVWDAALLAFAGPGVDQSALRSWAAWLVTHLLFLYFVGDLAYAELPRRGYAVLPRIGTRVRWWLGKVVTLAVLTAGFTLEGLLAVLLGSLTKLPWSWRAPILPVVAALPRVVRYSEVDTALAAGLILFFTTLLAMGCLEAALSIALRRSFYGFASASAILLLSLALGTSHPGLIRWLPGSQSMLIRHSFFDPRVPGFSFLWSLIYDSVLIVGAIGAGVSLMARFDVVGGEGRGG